MKVCQLGKVLLVCAMTLLVWGSVLSPDLYANAPFELVVEEYDGDLYYVEKTERFDLKEPVGVALALGGGGARALVNVGVLKALEEEQIPIDMVIGTSMGAIVAVLYGSGMSIEQMEELLTEVNLPGMFYMNFPFTRSLVSTTEVNHFIEKVIPVPELENFPIPTALLSHDLNHGIRYIATTGKAAHAVGGPYAIPLCFPGEQVGDSFLIDAGVMELTPAEAARVLGARVVIATTALDALPFTTYDSPLRSWARMINLIKEENAVQIVEEYADVVIEHEVGDYSFMDFHLARSFIDLGYTEAKKQIPEIKRLLEAERIALRSPAEKYAVPMAKVLQDVKHDRQVLDPLVVKSIFYYGKDHALTAQKLFRSPLLRPQFGIEAEHQKFGGVALTEGTSLDNLEVELRWKKLLPDFDLSGQYRIYSGQQEWEVGLTYFAQNYVVGAGYAQLGGQSRLHLQNEYAVRLHPLALRGETDLLINPAEVADISRYEFVSVHEAEYRLGDHLYLHPVLAFSNSTVMKVPAIYRGASQKPLARAQADLELVYEQRFRYSWEVLQLIQMIGVEYRGFIDSQYTDGPVYALGAGISADVNLLGIKPSRLGAFISNEPLQGKWKLGLVVDVTF